MRLASKKTLGQSLIELLLAIALAAVILPAIIVSFISARSGRIQQFQRIDGVNLLIEAKETLRAVKKAGWTNFANNGTYHPVILGTTWTLASGSEEINGFTRQITIGDVYRDASGNIIPSGLGAILDPSTKIATASVSWTTPIVSLINSTMYMTRYDGNLSFTQTTTTDFNAGTNSGTTVEATGGCTIPCDGDVILGAGGQGDWCKPGTSIIASSNLTGSALPTAVYALADNSTSPPNNYAYVTTGKNSSSYSMESIKVTDPQPGTPVPSEYKQFTANQNHMYGLFADASYVYTATDHPGTTVDIIQITGATYTEVGKFDPSGKPAGISVYIVGNTGYVTTNNGNIYTFDVSNKANPTLKGSVSLSGGNGNRVIVNGNYAYVITDATTNQLKVVDISNAISPVLVKSFDLGNGLAGVNLSINFISNTAYAVTKYLSGKSNFFVIDISNPLSPTIKTSADTAGMTPNALTVAQSNKIIVVGVGGSQQYQVFDVSKTPPTNCGGFQVASPATQVYSVATVLENDGDAYSYILTDDPGKEFQIIAGGPGGQYSSIGTFTSQILPITMPPLPTSFNSFQTTVNKPSSLTDVNFKIAVAKAVASSCTGATYTFVGPDGTTGSSFTTGTSATSGPQVFTYAVPPGANPGQCFKYQAILSTTDSSATPNFYDIAVNYSP